MIADTVGTIGLGESEMGIKRRTGWTTETTPRAYNNTWRDCDGASSADISSVEARIGAQLPKELRDLFRVCARGYPDDNFFENGMIEVSIGYILPLREDSKLENLSRIHRVLRDVHQFPEGLIPFAYDTGNADLFCLEIGSGKVVYWHHDIGCETQVVCSSLQEFLDGLAPSPF